MKLDQLKIIRKQRGLTREELAEISGISRDTINALENGRTNAENVKISTLVALAKTLKCKILDLLPKEYAKKMK